MQLMSKKQSATNALLRSLAEKNKTDNQEYSVALRGFQEIRDIAAYLANKYKWDPALSRAHGEYLTMLNSILKECER